MLVVPGECVCEDQLLDLLDLHQVPHENTRPATRARAYPSGVPALAPLPS